MSLEYQDYICHSNLFMWWSEINFTTEILLLLLFAFAAVNIHPLKQGSLSSDLEEPLVYL